MDSYSFILVSILVVTHCVSGQGPETVNNLDQNVKLTGVKVPKDIQLPAQNTLLRDALDATSTISKDGSVPPPVEIPGLPTSGLESAIGDLASEISAEGQASADLVTAFVNTLRSGGNVNGLVEAVNKLPEVEKNSIIMKIEEKINSLSPADIAILNETYPELLSAVTMNGIGSTSGNGQPLTTDATSGSDQTAKVQKEVHTHTKTEISKQPEVSPMIVPPTFLDVTHQPAAILPPGANQVTKETKDVPIPSENNLAAALRNEQKTTESSSVDSKTTNTKGVANTVDLTPKIPVSTTDKVGSKTPLQSNTVTFVNEQGKRIVVDSNSLPATTSQQTVGIDSSVGAQSIAETIAKKNTIEIPLLDGAGVNLIDANLPSFIDFNMNYDTSELKADQMELALRDRSRQEALRVNPTVITDSTQFIRPKGIDSTSINSQAPIVISAQDKTLTSGNDKTFISGNPESFVKLQPSTELGSAQGSMPVLNFDVLRRMNADVIAKHGEDVFRSWASQLPGFVSSGRTGDKPQEGSIALPFSSRENIVSLGNAFEESEIRSAAASAAANAAIANSASKSKIAFAPTTNRFISVRPASQIPFAPFVKQNTFASASVGRPGYNLAYFPYRGLPFRLPYRRANFIGNRRARVTIIPRYFPVEEHYRQQFRVGQEYRTAIPGAPVLRYPLGRQFLGRSRFPVTRFPCPYGRCIQQRYGF